MSAAAKFTLGRIGLFLAVLLILLPLPYPSLLVKLLAAVVVSFALSWFLLRGWRDQMSVELAERLERRKAEKARLRAALAGDDEPPPDGDGKPSADGDDEPQAGGDGKPPAGG